VEALIIYSARTTTEVDTPLAQCALEEKREKKKKKKTEKEKEEN
jgi:hypothetical protein